MCYCVKPSPAITTETNEGTVVSETKQKLPKTFSPFRRYIFITSYICSDLDGGNVCHLIYILHSGVVHVSIGELHTDASLVGHNMGVSDDEAIAADNETRAIGHWNFPSWKRVSVKQKQ